MALMPRRAVHTVFAWRRSKQKKDWLPFGGRTDTDTVTAQRDDPQSILHRFRRLLRLRRTLPFGTHSPEWMAGVEPLVAYRLGAVLVAANCGDEPSTLDLPPGSWSVAYATSGDAFGDRDRVVGYAGVIVPANDRA